MGKKIFTWAIVLLILSFIFALLFYNDFNPVKISAVELAKDYSTDKAAADKKYLDKTIIINGSVKAYYKLLGTRRVLELNTGDTGVPLICFFLSEKEEYEASQLQEGQHIIIKGKCTGEDSYSFVKGIKIEVGDVVNN